MARAADVCDTLNVAMIKQVHAPSRSSVVVDRSGHSQIKQESIYVGGVMYFNNGDGKWLSTPMPPEKLMAFFNDSLKDTKRTCTRVGDDTVDGQPVTVYTSHAVKPNGDTSDTRTWMLKASGLAAKVHNHSTSADGTLDITATYDYRDIKAPPVR
jgi:hypothetical protein